MRTFILVSLYIELFGIIMRTITVALKGAPREIIINKWEDPIYFIIGTGICAWAVYLLWL